jgi:prepilin peptidase CpaA
MFGAPVLWHQAILALAALLMILAATTDARRYRIPNIISLALLLLFPAYVLVSPQPVAWDEHLAIFALVLAAGFYLYTKGYAGAGDIKFLTVISLWAGPNLVLPLLFITTIAGGLLAILTAGAVYYRHRVSKSTQKLSIAKAPIPYGVAIALGGLCTLMMLFQPALLS